MVGGGWHQHRRDLAFLGLLWQLVGPRRPGPSLDEVQETARFLFRAFAEHARGNAASDSLDILRKRVNGYIAPFNINVSTEDADVSASCRAHPCRLNLVSGV